MEAAAINKISEYVNLETLNGRLEAEQIGHAVIAPKDVAILNLEHLLDSPLRLKQNFKTIRITDFINYIEANKTSTTTVYVHPEGNSAHALIDHGTHNDPEWAKHSADLELEYTSEYKAALLLSAQPRSQQDLIDYLEDWGSSGTVKCLKDEEDISLSAAIGAIRRLTIESKNTSTHEQHDMAERRSMLDEIEAKSAEGNLPSHFTLDAPIYQDLDVRKIHFRIGISFEDNKPKFRIRIMGLDGILVDITKEVETKLKDVADHVYVGSVDR